MGYIGDLIKERFPWLETDEDVIGSEVISDLADFWAYHDIQSDIIVNLGKIDWALLAQQKGELIGLIKSERTKLSEAATGIVNLIDHIQDFVVNTEQASVSRVFFGGQANQKREQPSIVVDNTKLWQIGCSKCDSKPGTWKIFFDGNGKFAVKCSACGFTRTFPPEELKAKPDSN